MYSDAIPEPTHHVDTGLPRPRRGARWRWATPRRARPARRPVGHFP